MSERRLVFLIAVAIAAAGTPSHAQVRDGQADSTLRRIQRLDSVMIARSHSVDSIRRSLVRQVPPVHVQRGSIQVRTDSALGPSVRIAVDSVAALIERRGGTMLGARVASHVLMVTPDSVRSTFWTRPVVTLLADTARRWTVGRAQTAADPTPAQVAAGLTTLVEQIAMQDADSALSAWVMVGRVPLRDATPTEDADEYIQIVTAQAAVVRRCRAVDVASCLDALGVDSLPGTRLDRWYAAEDYRSALRVAAPPREDSAAVDAWIHCRDDDDGASCRTAAVALPNDRVPMPLPASVRQAFLREVLDAGGAGAYDRLLAGTGTLRSRLTAAAGEPLDATVARWLERVERSRPERMRPPAGLILASLGWSAAFVALALIRRTSWA
jgi:hypothetical protein